VSRVSDKKMGWIPESFLNKPREILEDFLGGFMSEHDPDGDKCPIAITSGETCMDMNPELQYCAIAEYSSDDPSQVSFPEGARVLVIDQDEDGI